MKETPEADMVPELKSQGTLLLICGPIIGKALGHTSEAGVERSTDHLGNKKRSPPPRSDRPIGARTGTSNEHGNAQADRPPTSKRSRRQSGKQRNCQENAGRHHSVFGLGQILAKFDPLAVPSPSEASTVQRKLRGGGPCRPLPGVPLSGVTHAQQVEDPEGPEGLRAWDKVCNLQVHRDQTHTLSAVPACQVGGQQYEFLERKSVARKGFLLPGNQKIRELLPAMGMRAPGAAQMTNPSGSTLSRTWEDKAITLIEVIKRCRHRHDIRSRTPTQASLGDRSFIHAGILDVKGDTVRAEGGDDGLTKGAWEEQAGANDRESSKMKRPVFADGRRRPVIQVMIQVPQAQNGFCLAGPSAVSVTDLA
ncbi:hypothetical protein BDK51DRAFT_48936 [Blyttiomyces helicus]|uniref:Uncharacterized protein n=1 Tax=Blyttiomyces helicus TaxID=388810 RepID=A0A4P9VXR5_9FUNG|nr:hypothetical protein BDK51DRAFT_48936 [Blyttiomyces helicus]|eukprot:RKO84519.1 hypothetical protein BDK51DRAFT_48936 [Blyttiomyces helicus]